MTKDVRSKEFNIKDNSGLITKMIHKLLEKGVVRLVHFGSFKLIHVKNQKHYDFKKRKVVPLPSYQRISFSPAKGLHEMINKK